MKNKVWQAMVVIVFLVVLSRTALQRDLQASAFEEKINQSLENGYLPVVVLSQESTVLWENLPCGQQNMRQIK